MLDISSMFHIYLDWSINLMMQLIFYITYNYTLKTLLLYPYFQNQILIILNQKNIKIMLQIHYYHFNLFKLI